MSDRAATVNRVIPDRAAQTSPEQPWPVRLLSTKMSTHIERMPSVWVEGQIVQIRRRPGASTVYFTLRDAAVDFSLPVNAPTRLFDALNGGVSDGAQVVVHARPTFWAQRGSLQLAADAIRPVGVGELLARLADLRRALAAEGLFDQSRKRPVPFLPRRVGLICGRGSDAEHDVVSNAQRRWPAITFAIRQVAVQGSDAVEQVSAAARGLDADPDIDVIVIARGGGSLENLLPFSAEPLLRVIAALRTPVISAIGHEADTPLLDLVADVRASTPTDAAKLIAPDVQEERVAIHVARQRLWAATTSRMSRERHTLNALTSRPAFARPVTMITERLVVLDALVERGQRSIQTRIHQASSDIHHLAARVEALSPSATLDRGYAVAQHQNGSIVRSPQDVHEGEILRLRVSGGTIEVQVLHAGDLNHVG
ncbi:MAG: exodeoxyribonuclease VII large subunit [Actinomycetota bacterium]